MRVIISGGGTGGHIFPAVAIADAFKKINPNCEILFVGAKGKMEMEKVPAAGYKIEGLDIVGMQRKLTLKNLLLPFKVLKSLWKARSIVKSFKPDVAVGVGGYASGPLLQVCGWLGIPYFIQEQNSYAGVTNKILGKKAKNIFVAYKGMEKFFEANKLMLSGNPVREQITSSSISKEEAKKKLGVDPNKPTVLAFGGSLGARTLNDAIAAQSEVLKSKQDLQLLWQVGKLYFEEFSKSDVAKLPNIKVMAFIEDMATAYKAADVVVSRAGALTISELSLLGKPTILVPSPNVAEDHQTHNAMSLVSENAAILVKDVEAKEKLIPTLLTLMEDQKRQKELETNLLKLGKHNAAEFIAKTIIDKIVIKD